MPERLTLSDGTDVALGRLIGSGGEGIVYEVTSRPGIAIKVYHEAHRTADRAAKLDAMMASPPENVRTGEHLAIAWPIEQVIDANGRVAGFTMPRVRDAQELSTILNPSSRARVASEMTWQHLLTVAQNVAAVVDALHSAGYVVGDLSERNFVVTRDALVTLIDCDSIQVPSGGGKTFVSPVGTARFTAPELLGIDFESEPRTVEGDRFALAVLIFLIVSEGYHPFQGVPQDDSFVGDDISAIRLGAYAYSPTQTALRAPPAAPSIDTLPPVLAQFFEKTFVRGHRDPSQRVAAAAWQSTLDSISRSLQTCTRESRHAFWSLDQHCPWCARAQRIGVDTWKLTAVPQIVPSPPSVSSPAAPVRRHPTRTSPPRRPPPPPRTVASGSNPFNDPWAWVIGIAIAGVLGGVLIAAVLAGSGAEPPDSSAQVAGVTFTATATATATEARTPTATPTRTATPRPRATAIPTATPASGTRWITNTGGVGVRARTDCRDSSSGTSPGVPENTRVDLYQSGINRCSGWSRVRAPAGGQTRTVWVSNAYLSSAAPTPVPTRNPTRAATRVPTATPTSAASGTAPRLTCFTVSGGCDGAGVLTNQFKYGWPDGVSWNGDFDNSDLLQVSWDGETGISAPDSLLPLLPVGRHRVQWYDPPGGSYSGWSAPVYFNVSAVEPRIGVFGGVNGTTSSREACGASTNQIKAGFPNGWCVWMNYDSSQTVSYALNGGGAALSSSAFGSALSALPAGTHRLAVYDPDGGNYEGWSDWWTFTVLP